ncbi:MAG: hypothetical protein SGPRY_014005 [Prymnesium sp.]
MAGTNSHDMMTLFSVYAHTELSLVQPPTTITFLIEASPPPPPVSPQLHPLPPLSTSLLMPILSGLVVAATLLFCLDKALKLRSKKRKVVPRAHPSIFNDVVSRVPAVAVGVPVDKGMRAEAYKANYAKAAISSPNRSGHSSPDLADERGASKNSKKKSGLPDARGLTQGGKGNLTEEGSSSRDNRSKSFRRRASADKAGGGSASSAPKETSGVKSTHVGVLLSCGATWQSYVSVWMVDPIALIRVHEKLGYSTGAQALRVLTHQGPQTTALWNL